MFDISTTLAKHLETSEAVTFEVLNPDAYSGAYAGACVKIDTQSYRYHSLRSWMDLALYLQCRMLTPHIKSEHTIHLHFQKLSSDSFHTDTPLDITEKYGKASQFSKINKNEEPAFLHAYLHALHIAQIQNRKRILNLGVNQGDEFSLIQSLVGETTFNNMELIGIDHSHSAIHEARKRFNGLNLTFLSHDINMLSELNLEPFELIISIGTLQSPGINYKPFLMELVQNHLSDTGALILGFPNSRWIDGEMVYGAKMRNYRESDLSLMLSDIDYAKRYLQQKKFKVRIHGKEYLFLTATR